MLSPNSSVANSQIDRVFHALGDPTRRAILETLSQGPQPASHLAPPLQVSLPAVIQHLQILEQCGLVHTEKQGRTRICHLDPNGLAQAQQWLQERRVLWQRRFDRLGEVLAGQDTPPQES
jgi:DNA-binding transcriptional ArsR family regulator